MTPPMARAILLLIALGVVWMWPPILVGAVIVGMIVGVVWLIDVALD
jgi:hypothetical protein